MLACTLKIIAASEFIFRTAVDFLAVSILIDYKSICCASLQILTSAFQIVVEFELRFLSPVYI